MGLSAAENQPSQEERSPISITSEKMVLKNLENKIIFEGAVSIRRGEVRINADKAEVLLSESAESSALLSGEKDSRAVSRIITTGNVRVVRGAQKAKADKGVYKRGEEVFVLTGNPEVWDDDFHVKGKTITFFIEEERTLVAESQAVIRNGSLGSGEKKKLN
ncbi:MAG: LptA/OstA family protein [Nitrospiria bacterium]